MSRIWEALQKIDDEALQKWALPDIGVTPDEPVAKHIAVPNLVEIATHVEAPLDDVAHLRNSGFEQVQAERLDSVVFHTSPGSPAADRFRLLRMRLRSLSSKAKLRSVLVTSALPEDGKTTVALNLATALAEQRKRKVLLIDADLHRGGCISERLGLKPHIGLKECLHDHLNPLAAIRSVEPFGWQLLQAGMLSVAHPTELLRPQDVSELLRKLVSHFDWIVLDSPPVLALTDGIALSHSVDGSLLVARAGRTSSKAVEDAIALLGRKNVVGLVLNGISREAEPYSAYNQYYRPDDSPAAEPRSDAANSR